MLTFYRVIPGDPPRLDEIARLDEADVESIESSFDAAEHIPFAPFEPDPGARGLDPEPRSSGRGGPNCATGYCNSRPRRVRSSAPS